MAKIPFGKLARRALGWLVKKGLEEAEKELDKQREHVTRNDAPLPGTPSRPRRSD